MKNILKLFSLIAGLSLYAMENPLDTNSKTTISLTRALSGDVIKLEVPVVDGEYRISDLMAAMYAQDGFNPAELNKVMPHYTFLRGTERLSDDEMVSVESDISFVRKANYTKVHILVRNDSEETITLFGDLEAILEARFEDGLETFDEYSEYIKKYVKNTEDIHLDNLFLKDVNTCKFCDNISVYINKVITSSGQIFTKDTSRCDFPGARQHTALYLFAAIHQKTQGTITQTDIDNRLSAIIPQAWVLN